MVSMLDRGDSYRVEYMGSAMLTSMGTGLGVLQKPLRELYFGFRQAGKSAKLQERHLTMTSRGMTMTFKERRDSKNVQEVFYGVPNMLSWDAVQFVTVKGQDKKMKGAFEPIDNDLSRNKDNLFSIVDKKYHFLQQLRHPPLFCVVLRRTQGVKALDVHAFVCSNDEEALGLVRALNLVQNNYNADESHETGVFAYNPFGKESVRSAAGFDRQPGGHGGRKSHHNSPHGSLENQKPVRVLPREAPARAHSQRHHADMYGESNLVRARSVTNLTSSGIFQLTQEDFLQGAPKSRTAEDLQIDRYEEEDANTYNTHIERSLDRKKPPPSAANDPNDLRRQRPVSEVNNLRSVAKQSPSAYRRSAHTPQYGRGFDSVRDIDIGEPVPPPSREQKDSPREARYTADSKTGQGYGLLSGGQGPLPGYSSREGDGRRSPSYQRTLPRSSSPPREGGIFVEDRGYRPEPRPSPRSLRRQESHKSEQLRKPVPVGGQKVFPVGREPPPTPPQNLRPSTLERENPVRRSPSSPLRSPQGSRSPREHARADATGSYSPAGQDMRSKNSNPPGRGFKSKDSPGTPNRPVAMVTPQKIQGIRVLPMMASQSQSRSPSGDLDQNSGVSRVKSKIFDSRNDSESASNSSKKSSKQKNTQKLRNELSGNWQFNKAGKEETSKKSGDESQEGDGSMNEKLLLTKKKDAEIASVMQNLRFDYNDSTISPHGTNFERSLGYFP